MSTKFDYFSEDWLRRGLKAKTVRGGLYTGLAQGAVGLISLVTVPVMARLLQPADFGLVAMVTVFTGFAAMFVDAGFSMATIQRPGITHQQVSNLFWITAGLGVLIATVVCLMSPAIAMFYREPRLIPITIALSASFVFSGLTVQHQALLRRAMRFKAITAVQVICHVISYVLAIAVAWRYRTYWALVVLPLSAALLRMLAIWVVSGWRPSRPRRVPGMRSLVHFGANLTGFSFVNYFARYADNLLIGWWWGNVPLGFYERGYKLMMAPLAQINAPLMNVVVPALSRVSNEPAKYREAYFRAVGLLQIVSCPLMAFVAVTAPWIVDVLFGPRWAEAGPILRWLAIAGFVQPLTNSLGWLYISQGRTSEMMKWGLVGCSLIVLSFIIGLPWGPVGVACAYALMIYCLIVPLGYWFVGGKGPIRVQDLVRLTAYAMLYAIPTILTSMLIMARMSHGSSGLGLALSGSLSAIFSLLALFGTRQGRSFVADAIELLRYSFVTSRQSKTLQRSRPN